MTHTREHRSVLAAAERRLLIAIAGRLPRAIHSDHLTLLALAGMMAAGAGFALAGTQRSALWLVFAGLAFNWFGDSLDGTVARVRREERPRYGFYVDHVLDIVGTAILLAGLALSGFMTPWIAMATLAAYLLVTGEVFLATSVHGVFRMSFAGVGPTELRLLLAAGAALLFREPRITVSWMGHLQLFDAGGLLATVGLMGALAVSVYRNTSALAAQEPRPGRAAATTTATAVGAPSPLMGSHRPHLP